MRLSQYFFTTLREDPADAEIASHRLMIRAGLIRKAAAGIYTYMPLGQRAVMKVSQIVREEMERAGALEVGLPIVQPAELWFRTGRWYAYGPEMWRLNDRHGRQYALGPTHEEIITDLVAGEVKSWRQLPFTLFQIQLKYRDEVRPRFGVMRAREFLMKDAYSFDRDPEGMEASYWTMYHAYQRIFARVGLTFGAVEADSGAIGGSHTHEFMAYADYGEASLVVCPACGYAANVERATSSPRFQSLYPGEGEAPLTRIPTPGVRTIDDLVAFSGVPKDHTAKILFYEVTFAVPEGERTELVAALVRGDAELNEVKLLNALPGALRATLASREAVLSATGAPFGSAGPVGLRGVYRILADEEIARGKNFAVGANEEDWHYLNANMGRDFTADAVVDLRLVGAGDRCPKCGEALQARRGIEVGQVFQLGTLYSEKLGAYFLDQDGQQKPIWMGCYGIGVTRTVAAAIEQSHDEKGIIWPYSIAPYHAIVVPLHNEDPSLMATAEGIYREMGRLGVEVLLDDRDERAGVKFSDADLMGFPLRVTVGERSLREGQVEIFHRHTGQVEKVPVEKAASHAAEIVKRELEKLSRRADEEVLPEGARLAADERA
ncbi:MAG: proline--tRNA ligase [Clostridiales bacterium]|nr:proline--tRNA ligase [Clostridiales bacterium]